MKGIVSETFLDEKLEYTDYGRRNGLKIHSECYPEERLKFVFRGKKVYSSYLLWRLRQK